MDYFVENVGKISNEILFTNSNYDLIKCDKLAKTKHTYKLGDSMVVNHDEFVRRFNLVTNNMMLGDFPWDVAVVAGGMVSLLLDVNFDESLVKSSDIDIFIIGKEGESKKDSFKRVLDWFDKSGRTVYSVVGSVCTVYVPKIDSNELTDSNMVINASSIGADRYFQLISINTDNYQDVINNFDLSHIQVCYNGMEVYATYNAIKAMMERVTKMCNIRRTNMDRMIKSLYRGWNIEKHDVLLSTCPELEFYSNNPNDDKVISKINNMHKYNYPHVGTNITEDEKNILMAMMNKYTSGNMITMDKAKVLDSIVIGGNFETSYGILKYSDFKVESLLHVPKNCVKYRLQTDSGIVKLITDECRVISISDGKSNPDMLEYDIIRIKLQVVSNELNDFMEMMDTKAVSIITDGKYINTTRKILSDRNFVIEIDNNRGFENRYLRDSNMEALNLDEELKVGDMIKLVFKMNLHIKYPQNNIILSGDNNIAIGYSSFIIGGNNIGGNNIGENNDPVECFYQISSCMMVKDIINVQNIDRIIDDNLCNISNKNISIEYNHQQFIYPTPIKINKL